MEQLENFICILESTKTNKQNYETKPKNQEPPQAIIFVCI